MNTCTCRTRPRSVVSGAWLLAVAIALSTQAPASAGPGQDTPRVLTHQAILEAMRLCEGYDPAATTNGARFQAEVLLHLARQARARQPDGPPLLLGHTEWFGAFLDRTELDAKEAPLYALLAYRHGQDMVFDYRADRVVLDAREGPRPNLALNVVIWWPKRPGGSSRYSYRDTLSTPELKVTNRRLITYRLLDFGDMVVYDDVHGLTGRPTSGALGILFRIIGEGRVVRSRMAISSDGLQISRARAKKAFIGVSTTVTVYPDGRTEKDVPPDRADLAAIEARIKEPLEMDYHPIEYLSRAK